MRINAFPILVACLALLLPCAAHASFLAAGLDFSSGKGVVVVEQGDGTYAALDLPAVKGKWYLTGAASQGRGGTTLLYGANKSDGTGLLLSLDGGIVRQQSLPQAGTSWVIAGGRYLNKDLAILVGYDRAAGKPVALSNRSGSWTTESLPRLAGRVELLDIAGTPDKAYAVGVNRSTNKGVVLTYTNGAWTELDMTTQFEESFRLEAAYRAGKDSVAFVGSIGQVEKGLIIRVGPADTDIARDALPEVSHSWTLYDVWFSADGETGIAVGTDLSNRRGLILEYADGQWQQAAVSGEVQNSEILFVAAGPGGRAVAVGQDQAGRSGLLLVKSGGAWKRVQLPNVSFNWLLTGCVNR